VEQKPEELPLPIANVVPIIPPVVLPPPVAQEQPVSLEEENSFPSIPAAGSEKPVEPIPTPTLQPPVTTSPPTSFRSTPLAAAAVPIAQILLLFPFLQSLYGFFFGRIRSRKEESWG